MHDHASVGVTQNKGGRTVHFARINASRRRCRPSGISHLPSPPGTTSFDRAGCLVDPRTAATLLRCARRPSQRKSRDHQREHLNSESHLRSPLCQIPSQGTQNLLDPLHLIFLHTSHVTFPRVPPRAKVLGLSRLGLSTCSGPDPTYGISERWDRSDPGLPDRRHRGHPEIRSSKVSPPSPPARNRYHVVPCRHAGEGRVPARRQPVNPVRSGRKQL